MTQQQHSCPYCCSCKKYFFVLIAMMVIHSEQRKLLPGGNTRTYRSNVHPKCIIMCHLLCHRLFYLPSWCTYHTCTYLGADVNERAVGNDVVDNAFVLLSDHDVLQGDRAGREVLVVLLTTHTKQPVECQITAVAPGIYTVPGTRY